MTDITTAYANEIEQDAEVALTAGAKTDANIEAFLQGDHGALADALGVPSDDERVQQYVKAVQIRVGEKLDADQNLGPLEQVPHNDN